MAVASEVADVGLGIQSAAITLGLDFIPIGEERYDLAIPREYFADVHLQTLMKIIISRDYQTDVLAIGGYDTRYMGKHF